MVVKQYQFKKVYWGDDNSTEVIFEPGTEMPPKEQVSTVVVFPLYQGKVVMQRNYRGWGLPAGHREGDETPLETAHREAMEEANITIRNLRLVGWWKTRKLFETPQNAKYPAVGYQLMFIADVVELLPFTAEYESTERQVVPLDRLWDYHHDPENLKAVFSYVIDQI